MLPSTVPVGRTARRLEWGHLPPHVRSLVERRIGSPVVAAESQRGGFTPGFASVLTTRAGTHHFVKAASTKAQRVFADAYREEARKLGALPAGVPAPRLRWLHDADDWVVLETEHVDAVAPQRPWTLPELHAALDALETAADLLTPAPAALALPSIGADMAEFPSYWEHVRRHWGGPDGLPGLDGHGAEAAALASSFATALAGDSVVHGDVRDDNLLVLDDGRVLLCDWNWPVRGAAWLDSVWLMVAPYADGLDVDAVLAERRLTRDVAPDDVDVAVALVTAYFLRHADQPVPPTSPWLRDFQRWQGRVCWHWLSARRGWA